MSAMAILARDRASPLSSCSNIHLRMKEVLQRCILVARKAIDRLYLFLVRNILRIETGVTRNAHQLAVSRFVQSAPANIQ